MGQPEAYLTVASILSGFAVTVLMFRIQRELQVGETHPQWPTRLAWADYLVVAAIMISLLFVVLLLVTLRVPGQRALSFAAGSCAAAAILLAAYPLAILDHYRIEIGAWRQGPRRKGEPIEKLVVVAAAVISAIVFGGIVAYRWRPAL